jgi:hypothetical protein
MADVIVRDLRRGKSGRNRLAGSVREKRMRTSDGKSVRVLSLDANSGTFIDDLTTVFAKNVARARRENKQIFGSPDGGRTNSPDRPRIKR